MASDGLWDVMDAQTAVNFIRKRASMKDSIPHIAECLCQEALALGSVDNITAIIVVFHLTTHHNDSSDDEDEVVDTL